MSLFFGTLVISIKIQEMKEIDISIIIPFYNEEIYLQRCIESIIASDFSDYEIILINDGSKDNSVLIAEAYAKRFKNIQLINKENSGVSDSRNIGIYHAKGTYITFIDADDTIEKDYLSQLNNHSTTDGCTLDIIVCGFTYNYSYRKKKSIDIHYNEYFQGKISEIKIIDVENARVLNTIYNKLIRTSIIKTNNILFDTDLCAGEDSLFVYKCILHSETISIIPYCGYNYWITGDGLFQKIQPFGMYESFFEQIFNIKVKLINKLIYSSDENELYLKYLITDRINSFQYYMTRSLQKNMSLKDFKKHCKNLQSFIVNIFLF
jgi:glycosyltransferase involved in cell wall biosynthesis